MTLETPVFVGTGGSLERVEPDSESDEGREPSFSIVSSKGAPGTVTPSSARRSLGTAGDSFCLTSPRESVILALKAPPSCRAGGALERVEPERRGEFSKGL